MPRSAARHPINSQIGQRLRQRRSLLGLSQSALGELLGLSFQQVQKYEKGTNALSPDRLVKASEVLRVPITYFFEGLVGEGPTAVMGESPAPATRDLRLVHRLGKLPEPVRAAIERLVLSALPEGERPAIAETESAPIGAAAEPEPTPVRRRRKRGAAWDWADVKGL
jgi:transcriptional regulator with XRE-family HTH domain